MAWVKLDDQFLTHPKILAAGKDGRALFIAGLCYSAGHLTDGKLSRDALGLLAASADVRGVPTAERLVAVGLWEPDPGGWLIHDYHDHQPTAEAEREKRRRRADAGRKGGQTSKPIGSKSEANGEANGKRIGTPSPSPSPSPLSDVSTEVVSPQVPNDDDLLIEIAEARAARIGRVNPKRSWLRSVARSLDGPRAKALAAGGMTPDAIDLELDGHGPPKQSHPDDEAVRAQRAIAERNARRTAGTPECAICGDTGLVEITDGTFDQCNHRRPA